MNLENILNAGEEVARLAFRVETGDTVIQSETKLEGLLMAAGVAIGLGVLVYTKFKKTAPGQSKR